MEKKNSVALFERAKKVSPGGVHSPVRAFKGVGDVPRFMTTGRGVHLTDVDGNTYTDYCLSWGPLLFGHQDADVAKAVTEALGRGWSFGTAEPYSLELAELITGSIPWVEKIRFVNSGTEAVMAALRVARAVTGRSKILKFEGCYHGHVDSMLVKAGSGLAEMASPDSAGVSTAVAQETVVLPLNDSSAVEQVFARMGDQIAAVIIEPIPANNGLLVQTPEFLNHLALSARRAGSLVILDEVITGFRVGFGGMAERLGIAPDLVTYGKVIGGGFPVGAYGGKSQWMDWVAPAGPVYQAGTLSANPVAMTAGLAMLRKLKANPPYRELEAKAARLARGLEEQARKVGIPFKVQSESSMLWMIFGEIGTKDGFVRAVSEIPSDQKSAFARVFHGLLARGHYLAPSGFEVSFLATPHLESDLDRLVEDFGKVLRE